MSVSETVPASTSPRTDTMACRPCIFLVASRRSAGKLCSKSPGRSCADGSGLAAMPGTRPEIMPPAARFFMVWCRALSRTRCEFKNGVKSCAQNTNCIHANLPCWMVPARFDITHGASSARNGEA